MFIESYKVLSEPQGPQSDNLRFFRPQPDTSLHCKTTCTPGLLHHAVCLFTLCFR